MSTHEVIDVQVAIKLNDLTPPTDVRQVVVSLGGQRRQNLAESIDSRKGGAYKEWPISRQNKYLF
jgi:hypothetical protein